MEARLVERRLQFLFVPAHPLEVGRRGRRPPAEARPARSAPAEPAAYEAMWGAPQFSDDSSDSSSSDSEDDVPFDFSTDSDSEDDA